LIELYEQGKFPIDKLGKVYPVELFGQALEDLKNGSVSCALKEVEVPVSLLIMI
jgi:Zn-dependent alcohol dehydrogenase